MFYTINPNYRYGGGIQWLNYANNYFQPASSSTNTYFNPPPAVPLQYKTGQYNYTATITAYNPANNTVTVSSPVSIS